MLLSPLKHSLAAGWPGGSQRQGRWTRDGNKYGCLSLCRPLSWMEVFSAGVWPPSLPGGLFVLLLDSLTMMLAGLIHLHTV